MINRVSHIGFVFLFSAFLSTASWAGWTDIALVEDGMVSPSRNINAGVTLATHPVNNQFPFKHQRGAGMRVGVWDGGAVRVDHQEFAVGALSRAKNMASLDGSTNYDSHATHVAGTIAAAGVNPNAQGMAPEALVIAFDMNADEKLVVQYGASTADSTTNIYLSNHSYGPDLGWAYDSANDRAKWVGPFSTNRIHFGIYDDDTCNSFDQVVYQKSYYLPFFATGNARTDSAKSMGLSDGDSYVWTDNDTETQMVYSAATGPAPNDWWYEGMGTVNGGAVAKNVMAVGAVSAAVVDGMRVVSWSTMSDFSDWGPTDDGRIKPDLVSDGVDMLSVGVVDTNAYAVMSGTSMATPASCGASTLIQQMHYDLYGEYMRADLLKVLLLHTADDVDAPGPDYRTGWGLLNVASAADHLQRAAKYDTTLLLTNGHLVADFGSSNVHTFTWAGTNQIKATLCWMDPAADGVSGFTYSTNPVLIHDLDMRLVAPDGTVHHPYVLNFSHPTNYAVNGDNYLDNVEQIALSAPAQDGDWSLIISHKGTLRSTQTYALALSGARINSAQPVFTIVDASNRRLTMNENIPLIAFGASRTQPFCIFNEGTKSLAFAQPAFYGSSAFSISTPPAATNLAPGESVTFEVQYAPEANTDHSEAQLCVQHNATEFSPFVCNLVGENLHMFDSDSVINQGDNFFRLTNTVTTGIVSAIRVGVTLQAPNMGNIACGLYCDGQTNGMLFDYDMLRGTNLDNTTFSQAAFLQITNAANGSYAAPYRYSYLPQQSLNIYNGLSATGRWAFLANKYDADGTAVLNNWWIQFQTESAAPALALSDTGFQESSLMNGTFTNTLYLSIANAQFAADAADHVTVYNLPAGLTAVVQRVSGEQLSIELAGEMSDPSTTAHPYLIYQAGGRSRAADWKAEDHRFDLSLLTHSTYAFKHFSVSPTNNLQFAVTGGVQTIQITAPDAQYWTVSSTFSALQWETMAYGYGSGSVRFSVASNSAAQRTGSLVIGNQQIQLSQDGSATPTPTPTATPTVVPTPTPTATPTPSKPISSLFLLLFGGD